ncbi:hypothetical protein H257_03314 [Aphanomyces astaci]|uniref:Hemerythrin-like domain-containing protein n=1 Tax=Aphanomyces astaci TaxID=112090 RepID=W4H391_APHAT|nr:hypothetical protein H257_03314 [Aphanomyces astaci]ETV85608.1 hypothetical protein H257_03314 [Aphanomyces astaci]|eukprot:XP_009825626.1 hypothetical protein H257_03314 [Aphanomyces astaci]
MGATKKSCATRSRNHVITSAERFTAPTLPGWGATGGAQVDRGLSAATADDEGRPRTPAAGMEARLTLGWDGSTPAVEDIHVSFRRGFEMLVKNSLHHHHNIEDHSWFPRLKQLHPENRSEVDIRERDHRKLIELESRVASGDYDALVKFVKRLMDQFNRERNVVCAVASGGQW